MAIGFSGISTGADWNSIINQLLAIERRPLDSLEVREYEINQQISDYGQLKSAIDTFQSTVEDLTDSTGLAMFSTSTTDESVVTVSADETAAVSSYDIVVNSLASGDKLASSAYADTGTAVGTGTLSITVDGSTLDLTVDASNNTLAGLRDAINSDADNPGVVATILNESGGSRLILTSSETGAANAISVSYSDDDGNDTDENGLSRLFYIGAGGDGLAEQIETAQDASLTIDGFSVTSASNSVTGAITGVTLELVAAGSASVGITRDNSGIEEKIQGLVDAYNTLMEEFDAMEESSLENDSSLRRMKQGFVDILSQSATVDGADAYLFEIGVTRDKEGVLSLDSSDLADALANDFDRVSQILTEETTGFANRFYNYTDLLLDIDGVIDAKDDSLNGQLDTVQTQIERQELHMESYEKLLISQFTALDQTLAILQSTSSYLTSQLASLQSS
jgi:flagellar hook-associated protein 2